MKAILQRDFLVKTMLATLVGAVALSLSACGTRGPWPNLATVPPREEAFRLTKTQPAEAGQPGAIIDPAKARSEIESGLSAIEDDLKALEQQFSEDRSTIQRDMADYEKAVSRFSAAPGAVTGGSEAMATAQLYLSRITRTRDRLRRISDKSENHERDLTGIRAKISALPDDALAARARILTKNMSALHAAAAAEVAKLDPYAAGELARLRLLSFDNAGGAADASPTVGKQTPAMVWRAGQAAPTYNAALSGFVAAISDKTGTPVLVQVAGNNKALGGRNSLLIRAMRDLVKAGIPLAHVNLAVKRDSAAGSLELRLYKLNPRP